MRNAIALTVLVAALAAAGGCGGNKPKPDQVFLMPAPGIYEDGSIDPFIDNDPISRGVHPGVLYATDRAVAAANDRKYDYYTHERGGVLRLGEAHTRLGVDGSITWEEARQITLLKNRTENYPLEVTGIDDFGVLESTIPPFDEAHERSDAARERFADEIRERLARSDRKHVYIYVHGYKVNFENPVLVASELWHFLGYNGAFIAYSWPTKFSVWAYVADLENAMSSVRNLRTLILEVAAIQEVEEIHVIGYSAGTRMVSRVLADLGMYGYSLSKEEIDARVKLGNVILIGSDVDRDIMSGYLIDGALRIPGSLTLYQSQDDGALNMSKKVFRHDRSGQMVIDGPMSPAAEKFFADHPQLWIIDVTHAEGGTEQGGHSYFRTSPWVSSDVLMTLMYGLSPEQRGLVRYEDFPVWDFPADYVARLRASLAEINPSFGEAIRQNESPPGKAEEGEQ
jgi:esterase/lipase superfamily enzyme